MNRKVNLLAQEIQELTQEEKSRLYTVVFGFGSIASIDISDKLILISLVGLSSSKLKENNPRLTTLEFLEKLTKVDKKADENFYNFLCNLAILVDDLSYATKNYDACGLKSSAEIINKIKEILQTWLPF